MSVTIEKVREVLGDGNEVTGRYQYTNYKKEVHVNNLDEDQTEVDGEFWYTLETADWMEVDGLGTLEYIEGYSGGEGGGSNVYAIFAIGNQFFKKTGYYASHYGTDWDGDIHEVVPQQKTVTVYSVV